MLNDRKVETQMNAQKLWGEALKMKDWMLRESETRRTLYCATENGKKKSESVSCSVLSLCNPLNCSPPDYSVHGILQARIPMCMCS